MSELRELVSSVGFPIVISLFVLLRLEKTLKEHTVEAQRMRELMVEFMVVIRRCTKGERNGDGT